MPRRHPTSERRLPLRQPPAELPFSAPFPKCEPSQQWLGSPTFGMDKNPGGGSTLWLFPIEGQRPRKLWLLVTDDDKLKSDNPLPYLPLCSIAADFQKNHFVAQDVLR